MGLPYSVTRYLVVLFCGNIRNVQTKNVPCTQHSIFLGLAGSHLHADSGKNMGFLVPEFPRPRVTAAACGGADNGDAPAVATTLVPYPPS